MTTRGAIAIEESIRARTERAAFIPFVIAGDPTFEISFEIIMELSSFADAIEIGIPYSDPLADGPVIQEGALRALQAGMTMPRALDLIRRVRAQSDVPLIAFTYVNPIIQYGIAEIVAACKEAGADGFIVPDLPYEECVELRDAANAAGLALIPLVALTSKRRIADIALEARGFVYCVSALGVTGERAQFAEQLQPFVELAKAASTVPVAVGFGVSREEQVAELSAYADGVIVGSAIVKRTAAIAEANAEGNSLQVQLLIRELGVFCRELAAAGTHSK